MKNNKMKNINKMKSFKGGSKRRYQTQNFALHKIETYKQTNEVL